MRGRRVLKRTGAVGMGRQSLLGDIERVVGTVGMNRRTLLGNLMNLCILHSLQGRVQRGSARIYTIIGSTFNKKHNALPTCSDQQWYQGH